MSNDESVIPEAGIYQFAQHARPPQHPCACMHCTAMNRLHALADVFEEAGNYSAADCCNEWAGQVEQLNVLGRRMALAIVYGRANESGTPPLHLPDDRDFDRRHVGRPADDAVVAAPPAALRAEPPHDHPQQHRRADGSEHAS